MGVPLIQASIAAALAAHQADPSGKVNARPSRDQSGTLVTTAGLPGPSSSSSLPALHIATTDLAQSNSFSRAWRLYIPQTQIAVISSVPPMVEKDNRRCSTVPSFPHECYTRRNAVRAHFSSSTATLGIMRESFPALHSATVKSVQSNSLSRARRLDIRQTQATSEMSGGFTLMW